MSHALTLHLDGMHCASCVGRAERALTAVPGVTGASVNLATSEARIEGDPDPQAVEAALKAAGYPARRRRIALAVDSLSCASCVARAEAALEAVDGVISASVNLTTRQAHVEVWDGVADPGELARALAAAGYPARPLDAPEDPVARDEAEARALKRDALIAAALTVPVVVLAMGAHWVPAFHDLIMGTIGHRGSGIVQGVLTTLAMIGPGRRFYLAGIPALARGAPEMNALVALGTLAAWGYSVAALVGLLPPTEIYFEAAAVIVTLILTGRWMEARARGQAGAAIARLAGLAPDTATRITEGGPAEVPVAQVAVGDLLLARPGDRIAADGVVAEGAGHVDEAMLTGEPIPAAKSPGDPVSAGTVNGTVPLSYRVTAIGRDTALSRIARMVAEAQAAKLPIQAVVDRVTAVFVPIVIGIAVLTFAAWWIFDGAAGPALVHAVAVLVVACPCAMGLATPASILAGTGRGAELGVLFRRGDALQTLASARVVAFDKTGTLTEGRPTLTGLRPAGGWTRDEVLRLAAAVEAMSEHPIARAIREAAGSGTLPAARAVTALAGSGIEAEVEGHAILIGSARLMAEREVTGAGAPQGPADATPVFVAIDGALAGEISVSDPVKPTAAAAVDDLHRAGLETALISGDVTAAARAVARRLGIDDVVAEARPDAKLQALRDLRTRHGAVAFVGDGLNDAPALAEADVGIAIGTGTDVAIEAAEVILMSGDPRGVATAHGLSAATLRNIRQNLFWAFAYNTALIPVAAGVFAWAGLFLSPMLAGGAMALSSVFVVGNALRLRRFGRRSPSIPGQVTSPLGAEAVRP